MFARSKPSGYPPQVGKSLAEVPDLPVDLHEFDLDGLVGFVVSPLAAPANQAFGVILEFREEHTRLGEFGILTHRRLVSAGCRKPPQCATLDQQGNEIANRPAVETTVYFGDDALDGAGIECGKLCGKASDECRDLLIFVMCCHGSWLSATPCVVNHRHFRFGEYVTFDRDQHGNHVLRHSD
ncbi:hypothetical protein ABZV44_31320 [Nocardia sp. NPDC004860]